MTWHSPTLLIIIALGTARATRLVTSDTITEAPRRRLTLWTDDGPLRPGLFYFITCPWCVSIWLAAALVTLAYFWPLPVAFACAILTASLVAGLVGDRS